MARLLAAIALTFLLVVPAAAAKPDPRVTALTVRVAALERQVKQLRADMKREVNEQVCDNALVQDSFRVVFTALSKLVAVVTGNNVPAWESIARIDDRGACAAVGVTRP